MGDKPKIIHRDKLFGGKTAEQVHRETALGGRKCVCGVPAAGRAISFAPFADLVEKDPRRIEWLAAQNGGAIPMVKFKTGRDDDSAREFVKLGEVYYCDICRPACEKAMAKLPSWIIVDWDRGPTATKPQVGYGS
jgi:hypothetical protein